MLLDLMLLVDYVWRQKAPSIEQFVKVYILQELLGLKPVIL